jgi:hypothetical protein
MHATPISRCLISACVVLSFAAPPPALAAPAPADAFPNYESYIKISGQAPWITGDSAAFANRAGTPATGSGGIEELYFSKDLSKDTTLVVNGRALGGSNDYLASFNLSKNDVGSFETGYQTFRTYYDGVGGFFPLSNQFQKMGSEQLHTDRAAFWATATLALPNRPVFKLTFRDESRTGQKDSTEWAAIVNPRAVVVNGALVGTAAPANTPFVAPNLLNMDEHHQILESSMTAKVGKTTETFKATWDWANNNDWRTYQRYPGSTVIADPTVMVLDDSEAYHTHSFRILNQTETKFNDWIALDIGLSYFHLSSKIGGNWITPAYNAALNTVYTANTAANIYGGAKIDDYVGNVFLKLTPTKNWSADLGFRDECNLTASSGGFTTSALATGATSLASSNFTVANDVTYSHYIDHVATPEATVQYNGFSHTTLYVTYDDRVNHGSQHWVNPYAASTTAGITGVTTTASAPIGSTFFQDANQNNKDAKVGANCNLTSRFSVRAEVFRKDHQNRFIGSNDYVGTASYGALYATGYTFTGVKLTAIFKPTPQWSLSTRYQPQTGRMSVLANAVTGGAGNEATSGKASAQSISETIDWNPSAHVYLQGNLNVVYSQLQTAYPAVPVSTTTYIPTPIQNSDNNYITSSVLCGFVLTRTDDVQIQGFSSQASNYNPQIAAGGQPYGAGFREESISVGLKHKFAGKWIGEAKAGYFDRTNNTTGGFTNYHGPLVYVSVMHAL